MAMGRAPRTPRTPPSSDSSPTKRQSPISFLVKSPIRADDAECHGQVESGTFFLDVGGREIDGDVRGGNVVAAVLEGCADPVAALAHSGVGKADSVEVVLIALDAGAVDFHLNNVGVDAVDGGAESLIEHGALAKSPLLATRDAREMGHPGHTKACASAEGPGAYLTQSDVGLAVMDVT